MAKPDLFQLAIVDRLSDIPPDEWNALLHKEVDPFLRHEFLSTLEETTCVGDKTGWQVDHLTLRDDQKLIGALPLYLKQHSYGCLLYTSPSPRD